MSEQGNISEEQEPDLGSGSQEVASDAENIPVNSIAKSSNDSMEIHKHPHHPTHKKNGVNMYWNS
jgi:hypothetical protein